MSAEALQKAKTSHGPRLLVKGQARLSTILIDVSPCRTTVVISLGHFGRKDNHRFVNGGRIRKIA